MSYRMNRQKKQGRRSSFSTPSVSQPIQKTFITLDPHTDSFSIGTRCSTHQRNMFIHQRLAPSLQTIKNADDNLSVKNKRLSNIF